MLSMIQLQKKEVCLWTWIGPGSALDRWSALAEGQALKLYQPGQLIYLQGAEPECFYYLAQGRVKSFLQSEDGDERVLNLYEAGSLFGEASFFDGQPRVSSAVALTPCRLAVIDRGTVLRAVSQDPELALALMQYLARTVRLLSAQVDQMAFRPARWRVARYLLSLAPRGGAVRCTQEDIAAAVSVSRVTVSRILNDFARRGFLHLRYRTLNVSDPDALEQICME